MKRKRDRSESGQLRNKINRWVRFLSKERDWDYVFMLEMEYMKLRQMEEYFKEIISYKKLYVNTRNAARFIEFDFTSPNVDESSEISYKESLRLHKAWHLYNLIRTYRMFAWWD